MPKVMLIHLKYLIFFINLHYHPLPLGWWYWAGMKIYEEKYNLGMRLHYHGLRFISICNLLAATKRIISAHSTSDLKSMLALEWI